MAAISRRDFLDSNLRGASVVSASIALGGSTFGQTKSLRLVASSVERGHKQETYDVLIYGATACGVIAAIAARNEGVRVALLEPGRYVGGMVSLSEEVLQAGFLSYPVKPYEFPFRALLPRQHDVTTFYPIQQRVAVR